MQCEFMGKIFYSPRTTFEIKRKAVQLRSPYKRIDCEIRGISVKGIPVKLVV